jgi:GDP-4-dehydro-6-deoxy-D-mannose reductase
LNDILLVTGAAGFAGSHLLDRHASGRRVVAWRRPRGTPARAHPGVEWQAVNLTDRDAVVRHIARLSPTAIVHLAGAPNVRASWQNVVPHLRTNVLGTHHLLDAVRMAGHRCRMLIVSSAQVYKASEEPLAEDAPLTPPSPYGLSKLAQEQLALRAAIDDGLDVVVARPFNHVGPGQGADFALSSFARQIARIEAGLAPPSIRVGNLDARRDMTDVRDVVDAYLLVVARGRCGEAYNVCSGRAPTMRELLGRLCSLSRVPVQVETDPDRLRPNDVPTLVGDPSRIAAELGWEPRIPLDRTLADILESARKAEQR